MIYDNAIGALKGVKSAAMGTPLSPSIDNIANGLIGILTAANKPPQPPAPKPAPPKTNKKFNLASESKRSKKRK